MDAKPLPGKYCVVSVGSTHFNDLIQALDNHTFYKLLQDASFSSVLF